MTNTSEQESQIHINDFNKCIDDDLTIYLCPKCKAEKIHSNGINIYKCSICNYQFNKKFAIKKIKTIEEYKKEEETTNKLIKEKTNIANKKRNKERNKDIDFSIEEYNYYECCDSLNKLFNNKEISVNEKVTEIMLLLHKLNVEEPEVYLTLFEMGFNVHYYFTIDNKPYLHDYKCKYFTISSGK